MDVINEINAIKSGEFRAYNIDVFDCNSHCCYKNNCVWDTKQHLHTILEMLEKGFYYDEENDVEYAISDDIDDIEKVKHYETMV